MLTVLLSTEEQMYKVMEQDQQKKGDSLNGNKYKRVLRII